MRTARSVSRHRLPASSPPRSVHSSASPTQRPQFSIHRGLTGDSPSPVALTILVLICEEYGRCRFPCQSDFPMTVENERKLSQSRISSEHCGISRMEERGNTEVVARHRRGNRRMTARWPSPVPLATDGRSRTRGSRVRTATRIREEGCQRETGRSGKHAINGATRRSRKARQPGALAQNYPKRTPKEDSRRGTRFGPTADHCGLLGPAPEVAAKRPSPAPH